jgi:hypothetical protein
VPEHESATVAARLTFITDFFLIPSEMIIGGIMDKYGRKWPSVLSLFATAVILCAITFGDKVYPMLYIWTILFGILFVPILLAPFWLDYISPKT